MEVWKSKIWVLPCFSLPNKAFITEIKHYVKGGNKISIIKAYYCWSLANAGSPSSCSRSWYLLNKVFRKNITSITTLMLIKDFSWPMKMHEIDINNMSWSYSPYKFQKTWLTSLHFHINLGWFCNLRFDYSKTLEASLSYMSF